MKFPLLASLSAIAAALVFATVSPGSSGSLGVSSADAGDACVHTDFKTEMVRDACKAGGQKAAKDVMKKFNKEKNIKSCNQCHSKLAPSYDLKADGVEQFAKAGGKLLDAKAGAAAGSAAKAPAKK